jgi:hypothetical protein
MSFKPYDILALLVPGFLLLIFYFYVTSGTYNKDMTVPYTAIAFLLGYFLNILSSWLEEFYYFTWGGKPSTLLLNGRDMWQVRFKESDKVKALLTKEAGTQNPSNDVLFNIAMRNANTKKDNRAENFNAKFAFSRTLLTLGIIGTGLVLYKHCNELEYYLYIIPLLALWYKAKQYGYYYAKEVLNIYLS